jgi:hypothetical protein
MTDLYSANEMSGLWPGLRSQNSVENWSPHLGFAIAFCDNFRWPGGGGGEPQPQPQWPQKTPGASASARAPGRSLLPAVAGGWWLLPAVGSGHCGVWSAEYSVGVAVFVFVLAARPARRRRSTHPTPALASSDSLPTAHCCLLVARVVPSAYCLLATGLLATGCCYYHCCYWGGVNGRQRKEERGEGAQTQNEGVCAACVAVDALCAAAPAKKPPPALRTAHCRRCRCSLLIATTRGTDTAHGGLRHTWRRRGVARRNRRGLRRPASRLSPHTMHSLLLQGASK